MRNQHNVQLGHTRFTAAISRGEGSPRRRLVLLMSGGARREALWRQLVRTQRYGLADEGRVKASTNCGVNRAMTLLLPSKSSCTDRVKPSFMAIEMNETQRSIEGENEKTHWMFDGFRSW